jgi:hypothetical protein
MNNAYRAGRLRSYHDRGPSWYDHIDGRLPENVGKPGEANAHAKTPSLAQLRAQAGITDEVAAPLLATQGYSLATLHALENGAQMSRMTISRITAVLRIPHATAKEG